MKGVVLKLGGKRCLVLTVALMLLLAGVAFASPLTVIGTANYLGTDYNLIFEGDISGNGLVWLDYTNGPDDWNNQMAWAASLNNSLTVSIKPAYTVIWSVSDPSWRLPDVGQNPQVGNNQTTSEMGHLYYESLGKVAGGPLGDTSPFDNLDPDYYWFGNEYSGTSANAWLFRFNSGNQDVIGKFFDEYGLAVRPGEVSAVPEPATVLLLATGLAGLGVYRNRTVKGRGRTKLYCWNL